MGNLHTDLLAVFDGIDGLLHKAKPIESNPLISIINHILGLNKLISFLQSLQLRTPKTNNLKPLIIFLIFLRQRTSQLIIRSTAAVDQDHSSEGVRVVVEEREDRLAEVED